MANLPVTPVTARATLETMLDINRLENVKKATSRISAKCPACALEGADNKGTNLSIIANTGAFTCARYPGESGHEHRREIFRLVGVHAPIDPEQQATYRRAQVKRERESLHRSQLSRAALAKRASIIARHPWSESEVMAESPGVSDDPRLFLAALFPPDAIVWTGETNQSGTWKDGRTFPHRWKTVIDWQVQPRDSVGPMISPCTWKPGVINRTAANVASAPFVVLDFDGQDGEKPKTPAAIAQHISESLSIIRWLRESLCWPLAAIVHTGNVSLHAWFRSPGKDALESLKHIASALGIDSGLIGNPEHPCRLPGFIHPKSGKAGRVLWLKSQTSV
jgi:hypothetical protein